MPKQLNIYSCNSSRDEWDHTLTLKERWNPVTSVILFCTIVFWFVGQVDGGNNGGLSFSDKLHSAKSKVLGTVVL